MPAPVLERTRQKDPRANFLHDPLGARGGARNVGEDVRPPLLNPNTSHQPTVGASSTPSEDRLLGLQVEQEHAWRALNTTVPALRSPLEASEDPEAADVLAALEASLALLEAGGDLTSLEAGAGDYEAALAAITPMLAANDLAALNGALTSMHYVINHMRAGDTLAALPGDVVGTPEVPPGEGGTPSGEAPALVDTPHVTQSGATLNCTMGNWSGEPTSYSYLWQLDGVDAPPALATGDRAVQPGDVGKSATCVVTATNAAGYTTAPVSNAVVVTS
jgi:hypothetical protein